MRSGRRLAPRLRPWHVHGMTVRLPLRESLEKEKEEEEEEEQE